MLKLTEPYYKPRQKTSHMNTHLKILLLEDSPYDADLLQRELNKSKLDYAIEVVSTRIAFSEALVRFSPDIILSDHSLPSFDSSEAFRIAKDMYPEIPFILITGSVSEEFAVQCMYAGIDDYILKGSLLRLPTAIETIFFKKES
jgi:CheY-like chemotaxis protein